MNFYYLVLFFCSLPTGFHAMTPVPLESATNAISNSQLKVIIKNPNVLEDYITQGIITPGDKIKENKIHYSLLGYAARNGLLQAAELLIKHHADVNHASYFPEKFTPLYLALTSHNRDIAQLLIKHGADINLTNGGLHATVLHALAQDPESSYLKWALDSGANPNVFSLGKTPLHYAVKAKLIMNVKLLHQYGASITIGSETPLHLAAGYNSDLPIVIYLIDKGADLNARTAICNSTPLHFAVSLGKTEIVEYLLYSGAQRNICNHEGKTPLEMVGQNSQSAQIKELLTNPKAPLLSDNIRSIVLDIWTNKSIISQLLNREIGKK